MNQWGEVLKQAGYPTTAIVLDFETYFDDEYSLKKLSTVEYICDSRFCLNGLGFQDIEFDQILFYYPEEIEFLFDTLNFDEITVIGQNLKFDALILKKHFGIIPKYIVDILDLARHLDSRDKHSLAYLAKKYGTPKPKGDTQKFKGLKWESMTKKQQESLIDYCKTDVEIETHLFKILLSLITNPEIELPLATHTLHLYLNPQIKIDSKLGKELKHKMKLEMLKPLKDLYDLGIDCNRKDISGDKSFLTLLNKYLDTDEQVPMKPGKNGMIPALAREDEGMKYLIEKHHSPKVRALATARLSLSSWPLHIKRVDNLINQAEYFNGRLGAALTYYAGHTGRWGGTEGTNLQNLGGRGRKGSGTHLLIREIRQMLCAPDGYIFGIVDFAQIEARILAWLAGQNDLVQAFAEGRDVYSEFATEDLFREPIRKARKTDPEPVARMLTFKRGFAKDAILGCGYGMGTLRFYDDCRANDALRPAFDSGEYDFDFIDGLIKTYRKRYSKIPEFWSTVEKAWKFVTKYPKEVASFGPPPFHQLKFWNQNGTTIIQLPSGRCLYYPYASINNKGKLLYRWGSNLWGGALTENIVQAIARDILAKAILRLDAAGFNIVLHVHDEVVVLLDINKKNDQLQRMCEIISVVPIWAQDLPIAVEGKLVERYEK